MRLTTVFRMATLAVTVFAFSVTTAPTVSAFSLGKPLKSFEEERQVAVSQHDAIVAQFGGEYDNPELAEYVDRVGQRIVASSDMAGLPFKFTVLNSPIVNAFTIGGGHVYVTRGILAAMNTEAELAALLGHEVAHVTERHSARREARMEQDRTTTIGVGLLSGSLSAALLTSVLGNVTRSAYSRGQEADSDAIGLRSMVAAGYDPYGMPDMLRVLEREVMLAEAVSGGGGVSIPAWLQDHPQTGDRIKATLRQAERTGLARGVREVGSNAHLDAIDGILYGSDPSKGVVRNGRFLHPELGFAFDVPENYELLIQPGLLVGMRDSSSFFIFTGAEWPENRTLEEFAISAWYAVTDGGAGGLDSVTETQVNGLDAVITTKRMRKFGLTANLASVAFRVNPETVYGFSFVVSGNLTNEMIEEFRGIAEGFTLLTPEQSAAIKPYRVRIITAGSLDTVESLAERSVYENFEVERLRSLNGLENEIKVGDRLKLIVEQ